MSGPGSWVQEFLPANMRRRTLCHSENVVLGGHQGKLIRKGPLGQVPLARDVLLMLLRVWL